MRPAVAALCLLFARNAHAGERLDVEGAVRLALKNHPTLAAQRAQVDAVNARRRQALAGFLPSLTGSLAYQPQTANFVLTPGFLRFFGAQRSFSTQVTDVRGVTVDVPCTTGAPCPTEVPPTPRPTSYDLFNFWSAALGINWVAWDWGRTPYGYRSSGHQLDAQRLTLESARAEVALQARLAYFGALAAEAAVAVFEEAVRNETRHLDRARAFYEVGSRTKIDVVSAEAELAAAELRLERARAGVATAHAQLAVALGEGSWKDWQLVVPPEPPPVETVPPAPALLDEALAHRAEPRELRLRARAWADQAKAARGAFLPQLVLSLGPSFGGTDITGLTANFSIGVSLAYPLGGLNPLLVSGQMAEARANERAAAAQAEQSENVVRLEVVNARTLLDSSRKAVAAARKLEAAARERRDLAQARYEAGVGSILELTDAELAYVDARFEAVRALLDRFQAAARLDRALGRD
jgi:outer membrane protein